MPVTPRHPPGGAARLRRADAYRRRAHSRRVGRPSPSTPSSPSANRRRRRSKSSAATNARTKSCARSSEHAQIRSDPAVIAVAVAARRLCRRRRVGRSSCSSAARPSSTSAAPIARVSLTSADIADALVTSPNQLLVNGKMPGTISMFVWERAGGAPPLRSRSCSAISRGSTTRCKQLFPGETIEAQSNGKNIVLSGLVSSKDVVDKAINVAAGYVDKNDEVVTLLQVQRSAAEQPGAAARPLRRSEPQRDDRARRVALHQPDRLQEHRSAASTTQQFAAPASTTESTKQRRLRQRRHERSGKFTFSDFLNLFLFDEKYDLGAVIKALQTKGLFQSLAEPNLVAESGKEASFLAGGEFPIPIAQGSGGNVAISVQYKEFGVRLNFTPIVIGNRVHLKVRPGSQHARLRQRRRAAGIPHSGAEHAPHRDRARAAGRPDVRHRRPDEQHDELDAAEDSGHRRHPDSRPAVQEQGGAEEPDRARRDDHAADSAEELARRDREPAAHARAVPAADAAEEADRAAAAGVHAVASAIHGAPSGSGAAAAAPAANTSTTSRRGDRPTRRRRASRRRSRAADRADGRAAVAAAPDAGRRRRLPPRRRR